MMKTRAIIFFFAVSVAAGQAADATVQQAYEARAAGRQEEAIKLFLQHLDKRPGDTTASLEAAEICASRGEHEKAAMILTRAVAANPADEQLSYRLAAQEAFAKRTKDAKWRFGVLTKSSDRQLASMAQASLDALEESEKRELEAKKPSASPGQTAADARRLEGQFAAQRVPEAGFVHPVPDMRVEVAIGAFGRAEGPVDIEGKGLGHGAHMARPGPPVEGGDPCRVPPRSMPRCCWRSIWR